MNFSLKPISPYVLFSGFTAVVGFSLVVEWDQDVKGSAV